MNSIQSHITVPLSRKAHSIAGEFTASSASLERGKQVYLNTLAVYAVHCYLGWLQIESSLEQSDSWSLGIQNLSNVADLFLPGIGYLECRPVLPGEASIIIPPQATEDRIGYVGVQLDESLERAELLGFYQAIVPSNQPKQISIFQLQPLDVLLERLSTSTETPINASSKIVTNLSRWLENTFENGWLTMENLFDTQTVNPVSVRNKRQLGIDSDNSVSGVKRGRAIDLRVQLQDKKVALIVTCQPADETEEMEIRLQVYPINNFVYLPPNLQLTVLDDMGAIVPELEARARSADNCIQLEFTGKAGERFSVKIALEDVSITEDFQI